MAEPALPAGLVLKRTTPEFDATSTPDGLRRAHQIAPGVWGVLVVREGALTFTFEDEGGPGRTVRAGDRQVIPPERPHAVDPGAEVRFAVEFYAAPD